MSRRRALKPPPCGSQVLAILFAVAVAVKVLVWR